MESDPHDPRYAPPVARVEDVAVPADGLQLAPRSTRFWAAMVDLGLGLFVAWLVSELTPLDPWYRETGFFSPQPQVALVGFGLFVLLHGWLLVRRGQTIGKALMKIRIVRPGGALASPGRVIALRYGVGSLTVMVPAVGQLFGIVDCLLIFRASRRCLHDQIADTIVVRA